MIKSILNIDDLISDEKAISINGSNFILDVRLSSIMRYIEWAKDITPSHFEGEKIIELFGIILKDSEKFLIEFSKLNGSSQAKALAAILEVWNVEMQIGNDENQKRDGSIQKKK